MSARTLSRLVLAVVAVLALGALAPRAAAGVIVVAQDGSGDTTTVTAALSLAAPGDLILVRPGNYVPISPFEPDTFYSIEKSVTIVGDGAGATIGMARVRNIPAGKEVVLRNLTFGVPIIPGLFLEKLGVLDCAGTVLVEDCTIIGMPANVTQPQGFPAVDVTNSDGVTLTRCTIRGGAGLSASPLTPFTVSPGPGGPGVVVTDSKVALQHCTVFGGAAGSDTVGTVECAHGGDALTIGPTSTVFVAGGSITGGHGTDGGAPELAGLAHGGNGIVQDGAFSLLRLVGVEPQGGTGGVMSDGSSAPSGESLVATAGSFESFAETARGTSIPPTVHPGEPATLQISGRPGELAKIMVGLELLHAQLGGKKGVFNLSGAFIGPLVLGTIPASGVFELPVTVPAGALLGLEGLRLQFQALTFGADGLMFGNPSATLLLAPGL